VSAGKKRSGDRWNAMEAERAATEYVSAGRQMMTEPKAMAAFFAHKGEHTRPYNLNS